MTMVYKRVGFCFFPFFSLTGDLGAVCDECLGKLHERKTPRLALANGMWIGKVPFELAVLTMLEQMLVV